MRLAKWEKNGVRRIYVNDTGSADKWWYEPFDINGDIVPLFRTRAYACGCPDSLTRDMDQDGGMFILRETVGTDKVATFENLWEVVK